jgi:hypothetical protein
MIRVVKNPSIILPTVAPLGTEVEAIADALEHVSLEAYIPEDNGSTINQLYEKTIFVSATEVVAAGVPGNLNVWIEISPYPTSVSVLYWAILGLPATIVGTGVNGTLHTVAIPWNTYSPFFRAVVQSPVPLATATWSVQVTYVGQG